MVQYGKTLQMEDLVGQTLLKKYFLRRLIGRGATSDVYLAWDKLRNLELAIKVLNQKLRGKSGFLGMFKNEAKFMEKLSHDNIVPLYDFEQENRKGGRIVFIVMKYIKGVDLRHLLIEEHKGQPLDLLDISQILAAVCKALSFAHRSKVLHGDIKAANILIAQGENNHIYEKDVFLTDFGGSRWNLEQKGGGTPVYMSPELINGGPVTEKTDIYALGITLYEMLSGGQLPFRGNTSSQGRTPRERIAWEKLNKPLPPLQQFNPNLPSSVVAVVEKALNRDPKLRQASIIEVFNEFEHARNPDNILSVPDQNIDIKPPPPQPQPVSPQKHTPPSKMVFPNIDRYYLLGIRGEMKGRKIDLPITGQKLIIGRSQDSDLRLTNRAVSRNHALIMRINKTYYLRDEESAVGTFVNGLRISSRKNILVEQGDQIRIGTSEVFELRSK